MAKLAWFLAYIRAHHPVHARLVFLTQTSSAPLVELEEETNFPPDKAALELAQVRIRI